MRNLILALCGATALLAPAAAHAQSGLFSCDKEGNRQGSSAAIGAIIGGILGNQLAGDNSQTLGTVIGAGAGAAVGSSIGCNMGSDERSRAENATRVALDQNRSQTWSSSRSGMSGRVDIINTYYRDDVSARVREDYYRQDGARTLGQVRFAPRVEQPSRYTLMDTAYRANGDLTLRASAANRGSNVGQLRAGQRFQALARTNSGWLLVGQNGVAVGYVPERSARVDTYAERDNRYGNRNNTGYRGQPDAQRIADRQMCRTFDQTIQTNRSGSRTTQRYNACQNDNGQWVIQA